MLFDDQRLVEIIDINDMKDATSAITMMGKYDYFGYMPLKPTVIIIVTVGIFL